MPVSRCTLLGQAVNRRSLTSLISGWWRSSAGVFWSPLSGDSMRDGLPVFLSLPAPNRRVLLAALIALHVWSRPLRPAKIEGVHRTFPFFVKFAYAWLLIAAGFWMLAAWADHGGGIWGAARHALTVGFITTMVFAIGQRVLPAFGGARVLYSPRLMLASLVTLTAGCALPVGDPSLRRILSSGLARAAMFRRN